jgi:hypothetical protein
MTGTNATAQAILASITTTYRYRYDNTPVSWPAVYCNICTDKTQETIDCGPSSGCSVGRSDSESRTVSATFNLNGPAKTWGSMNFGVSQSWSTGNAYTCNGVQNETVCVWYNVAHTTCKLPGMEYVPEMMLTKIRPCKSVYDPVWRV